MNNRRHYPTLSDYEKLEGLRGREFTDKELLKEFGYSPSTYILDTFLTHEHLAVEVSHSSPRRWRVPVKSTIKEQ